MMNFNRICIVEKPWGREIRFALESDYAGKVLEVRRGFRLSLQYHKVKKETTYVLEGRVRLTVGQETKDLTQGVSFTILPGVMHRVEAIEDARIIEVSTAELDDVVRVEDDFGREGGD